MRDHIDARFQVVRKGYDRAAVDAHIARLSQRESEARARAAEAEERLAGTEQELTKLRERLEDLESERVPHDPPVPLAGLGREVERLLQGAVEISEEIRDRAERQAAEVVRAAENHAAELVEAARADRSEAAKIVSEARLAADDSVSATHSEAERRAHELRARAQSEATRIVEEAERRATGLIAEADREGESRIVRATVEAERVVSEAEELRRSILAELTVRRREVETEVDRLREQRDAVVSEIGRLRALLDSATPAEPPRNEAEAAGGVTDQSAGAPAEDSDGRDDAEPADRVAVVSSGAPRAGVVLAPEQEEAYRRIFGDVVQTVTPPGEGARASPPTEEAELPASEVRVDLEEDGTQLVRALKRALQEEQNLILDAIRQAGEALGADAVVPTADEVADRIGDKVAGGAEPSRSALVACVAAPLVEEVRRAVEQALRDGEGGTMTADRVSAVYRS